MIQLAADARIDRRVHIMQFSSAAEAEHYVQGHGLILEVHVVYNDTI